jgi:hypothetical protein
MAFENGVYTAPDLDPNHSGLFSIVKPENHSATANDERWVRGYSQEFDAEPKAIRNLDVTDNTAIEVYATADKPDRFIELDPFFIEVEDLDSTFGILGQDRYARVLKQLDAASQKAVEKELWDGEIAVAESLSNPYLTKAASVTKINSGTAMSAALALAAIEHDARNISPTGEQPIIHMTADVASVLGTKLQFDKDNDVIVTRLGTKVVIGAGYSGNGPVGDAGAAATITNKWIYATGAMAVHLGNPEVVNGSLAQGYDVSGNANDMRIKAFRTASALFDTSIHLAARVDLSA